MSLLTLIIALVVVGVVLWLINGYLPINENRKKFLNVVVAILVIIWLLFILGIIGNIGNIHIG